VSSAVGAAALASGTGATVTLYGTPELLNAYLAANWLKVSGSGSIAIGGAASGTISVVASDSATAAGVLPSLALPASFTVRAIHGDIQFPNAVGGSTEPLTMPTATRHSRSTAVTLLSRSSAAAARA